MSEHKNGATGSKKTLVEEGTHFKGDVLELPHRGQRAHRG